MKIKYEIVKAKFHGFEPIYSDHDEFLSEIMLETQYEFEILLERTKNFSTV